MKAMMPVARMMVPPDNTTRQLIATNPCTALAAACRLLSWTLEVVVSSHNTATHTEIAAMLVLIMLTHALSAVMCVGQ